MWMDALLTCIFVYHVCAWNSQRQEKFARTSGTGVIDSIDIMLVLGIEPQFSATVASAFNC